MIRRRAGRVLGRIARGDLGTRGRSGDRRAIEQAAADLPRAIERGELVLHFQPIVELRTGRCYRVEGLVRWMHPTLGPIDPRDIVRLAETTGSLITLAVWAVREAIRHRAAWQKDDLELGVAVNLAGAELTEPGPTALLQTIRDARARPAAFTFDVPAAAFARGDAATREGIRSFAAAGARVALDDVSGADPPSRAHAMDIDELKIARAVVLRAVADQGAAMSLRRLVERARDLGLNTVAVGVEDEPTCRLVASLGCDLAQGFWMSRPLATVDATRWRDWMARLALGGATAVTAYTGMARVAVAAPSGVAAPATALGLGTTCCALPSEGHARDVGVAMRQSVVGGARVFVEASITPLDTARIVDAVTRDVDATQHALGASFDSPPSVYVFGTRASFSLALQRGFGQRATDSAALAAANGGVAFAAMGGIAVNWQNVQGDPSLAIMRHELTHLLVHQLAGIDTELPAWFDEGLATLAERDVVPDAMRDARERSSTMVLLRQGGATLQELSSARDWTLRNAEMGGRGYTFAASGALVLRSTVGPDGLAGLLARMRAVGFAQAFGEVTGGSVADFSSAFPARFAADYGGVRIMQAPTTDGVRWAVSGLASQARVRVAIEGQDYHLEFEATADREGTYAAVFGSTAQPGDYTVTVFGGAGGAHASLQVRAPAV